MTKHTMTRRHLVGAAMLAPLAAWSQTAKPLVEVWKDPNCGCCKDWVAHLEANGFATKLHDTGNTAMRLRCGSSSSASCCQGSGLAPSASVTKRAGLAFHEASSSIRPASCAALGE